MIVRPFTLPAADGESIRGEVRLPDGPPPRNAVVIVHGFKGFKDWGFFPPAAEYLAAEGHAAVTFNFSLNGVGDDPLAFDRLDAFARNTLTREVDEVRLVLAAVREGDLLPLPPRRVGLLGHSRGGGDAILAAREDGKVDALVTWAAVADFDRWTDETKEEWRKLGRIYIPNARTGQQMPLDVTLLDDFMANRERLEIERAAAELETPWLAVHGRDDAAVRMDDAERLARANPAMRLEVIDRAGHTFEVGHPFRDSSPEFDRVLEVTAAHFGRHLDDGATGSA